MPRLLLTIILALLAGVFSAAKAQAADPRNVVSAIQERYEKVTTIAAEFRQLSTSATGEKVFSEGKVFFKKPGKMRWQYFIPYKDELVSDGKTVWFYQPDLNQAVATPSGDFPSTMATDFLSGVLKVGKDFEARVSQEKGAMVLLELTPKGPQANVKKVFLRVDSKENLVQGTIVEDAFGGRTEVNFTRMEVNIPIKDSFFEFKPPKGAGVIKR